MVNAFSPSAQETVFKASGSTEVIPTAKATQRHSVCMCVYADEGGNNEIILQKMGMVPTCCPSSVGVGTETGGSVSLRAAWPWSQHLVSIRQCRLKLQACEWPARPASGEPQAWPGKGVAHFIPTEGAGCCGEGPVIVFILLHLGRQPGCLPTHQLSLGSGEGHHISVPCPDMALCVLSCACQ